MICPICDHTDTCNRLHRWTRARLPVNSIHDRSHVREARAQGRGRREVCPLRTVRPHITHPPLPSNHPQFDVQLFSSSPVQRGVQEWKARISIRSQPPSPPTHPADGVPITESVIPESDANPRASLTPYLCYPCHTTLTSRSARPVPSPWPSVSQSTLVSLPAWTEALLSVSTEAIDNEASTNAGDAEIVQQRKMGRDEMTGIVNEFMLGD